MLDMGSSHAIFVSEMVEYNGSAIDKQFLYNALTLPEPATLTLCASAAWPYSASGAGNSYPAGVTVTGAGLSPAETIHLCTAHLKFRKSWMSPEIGSGQAATANTADNNQGHKGHQERREI